MTYVSVKYMLSLYIATVKYIKMASFY